jgi:hypothetical protein
VKKIRELKMVQYLFRKNGWFRCRQSYRDVPGLQVGENLPDIRVQTVFEDAFSPVVFAVQNDGTVRVRVAEREVFCK